MTIGDAEVGGLWGATLDLRVFAAEGARGASVITGTALAGPDGPLARSHVEPGSIGQQLNGLLTLSPWDGVKIGRLTREGAVKATHDALGEQPPGPIVLAPAYSDRRGRALLRPPGVMALRTYLVPRADALVVDLSVAEQLTERPVRSPDGMREACRRLMDWGPRSVLITGGQLEGTPMDLLTDGAGFIDFGADRREGAWWGAGDMLTATLLARLSAGRPLPEAVDESRGAVLDALDAAVEAPLGCRLADPMGPLYPKLDKVVDPVPIRGEDHKP